MRTVRFEKPGSLRLAEAADPEPPPGWARVQVKAAGISPADHRVFSGKTPAEFPFVSGREWAGVVDKVGSAADESWLGRRVTGDNEITCLRCRFCRCGEWRRCVRLRQVGAGAPGAFADYLLVPMHNLHTLADCVTFEQGALLQPLADALAIARNAGVRAGTTALVLGAGPTGLNAIAALKFSGAVRILCLEKRQRRQDLAQTWGAWIPTAYPENLPEMTRYHHSNGTDLIVDTTGDAELLQQAARLCPVGATIVLTAPASFPHQNDLRVIGPGNSAGLVEIAALLAGDALLRTESMITHRHALEECEQAFRVADDDDFLKGVFIP